MTTLKKLKEDLERNVKIKEQLDGGKTLREVADNFNVSIGLPDYLKRKFDEVQKNLQEKIDYYEYVIQLFKSGYTISQIADLENTTKQNISRILKIGGVERTAGGKSKKKADTVEKIKNLTAQKYTLEDISEMLNLDEMKVRQYAYGAGIDLISNTEVRVAELSEKIIKYRDEGLSQMDIAELLGISQAYVSKILLNEDMRVRLSKDEYEERDKKVYEDFTKGLSVKDLALRHDLGEINVRRILYKFTKSEESKTQ